MTFLLESRSLPESKQDGDSPSIRRQALRVAAAALPPCDTIEEADPILPRQREINVKTGGVVFLTNGNFRPSTTLRMSVRPTGTQKPSNASRSVQPTTTSRPLLGPSGFQTIRPALTSAAPQPGRPLLGPSGQPSQLPVTSSSRSSLIIPVTTEPIPNASGLAPVQPVPASTRASGSALPDETATQPVITATPSSGPDAGSIVGYILLALVGLAALFGGFIFIKTLSKRTEKADLPFISGPSPFSDGSSTNEAPMAMARSYPDIAARLGAIAARAERGEHGQMAPPPPSFQDNADRRQLENPFVDNVSANSMNERAPMVMARSYPGIAAELGAIAARAERGEPGSNIRPPPAAQNQREEREFPFAESDAMPNTQQFGRPAPALGRQSPGSFYTERSSGDVGLESPVAPDLPYRTRGPRNVR